MYRLLAIARYEDRFVIPPAHAETADRLLAQQGACGLNFPGGPGGCDLATGGGRGADLGDFHPVQASRPGANGNAAAEERAGAAGAARSSRRLLPVLKGGKTR
jgi:hypothetical protein